MQPSTNSPSRPSHIVKLSDGKLQALASQLSSLEVRHASREAELQRVLEGHAAQHELTLLRQRQAHEAAMDAKNAEIRKFRSELDGILHELPTIQAELQKQPPPQQHAMTLVSTGTIKGTGDRVPHMSTLAAR